LKKVQHLLLPLTPRLAERLLEGERVWALLRSAYLAGAELGDQGADRAGHGPASAKAGDAKDESEQPSKEGIMGDAGWVKTISTAYPVVLYSLVPYQNLQLLRTLRDVCVGVLLVLDLWDSL